MPRDDEQYFGNTFNPEGRLQAVEYAREATKRGAPAVGVKTEEGVVLAAELPIDSGLVEKESIEKLYRVDDRIQAASSGHVADAHKVVDFAREVSGNHRFQYGESIDVKPLSREVEHYMQHHTQQRLGRPFGCALLVAGVDESGPRLYQHAPNGAFKGYKGCAIGMGADGIEAELEEAYSEDMSLEDATELAVNTLADARESRHTAGDMEYELACSIVDEDGIVELGADEIDDLLEA